MSIEITNKKRGRRHARHNINKKKDLKKRVKTYKKGFLLKISEKCIN